MVRELGIFAKHWQPGEVKTRLAARLGDDRAALFHRACVESLLTRFAGTGDRRVLAFAPGHRRQDFAELAGDGWRLEPQSSGDLGVRMSNHFGRAFAAGCSAAVLIGTDSPTLPERFIDDAFEQLRVADVVVGPADDGGYYLIGLSRFLPQAFEGIAWSTSSVRRQTIERLSAVGCSCALLPPWYDVDTPLDLARLRAELSADPRKELIALKQVIAELMTDKE